VTKTTERGVTLPPLPEIDDVTRREFLIGAAGLLLLPAGCGGQESDETSGETRTVEHELGTTKVPVEPGRIVAVTGLMDLDALLALGLQPVAAGANFENDTALNPWAEDRLDEDIGVFKFRPEINVEQVATFEPDLILGHIGWMEPVYEQLSQVAPTVVVPVDGGVEGPDAMWREPMRIVARAVGREERGEEVLAEIDRKIESARERLSGLRDLTVSIFFADETYQAFFTRLSYPGYVVEQLGLSRPQAQREVAEEAADAPDIEFSNERLDLLEADVIFGLSPENARFMDEFESRPLFQRLGAVRADNYVRIAGEESNYWNYPTVFTAPLMVDSLLGHLERLGFLEEA
jgi:iron complex transport system substrate-binding protein